jgi:YD repeat-containing protein
MWIFGGFDGVPGLLNDVWSSVDGIDWVESNSLAGWSAWGNHASVVFNEAVWVLGGDDVSLGSKNDVWRGSPFCDGGEYVYAYDDSERLTDIDAPVGVRIDYAYDAAGNRLQKHVYSLLTVSEGDKNPASGGVALPLTNHAVLQMASEVAADEAVLLQSLGRRHRPRSRPAVRRRSVLVLNLCGTSGTRRICGAMQRSPGEGGALAPGPPPVHLLREAARELWPIRTGRRRCSAPK